MKSDKREENKEIKRTMSWKVWKKYLKMKKKEDRRILTRTEPDLETWSLDVRGGAQMRKDEEGIAGHVRRSGGRKRKHSEASGGEVGATYICGRHGSVLFLALYCDTSMVGGSCRHLGCWTLIGVGPCALGPACAFH